MVTLSSSPSESSLPHDHREIAESFGRDAAAYDRARPRYPRALAEAIVPTLPGRAVVDVGIGTGLAALPFRDAGCEVLGVEPDERMAVLARKRGFAVEVARFEEWDAAGRLFDGVISGQTWHWVDPIAGAAKAAAVLRPQGRIAIFWNAGDPPVELAARFAELYRSLDTGLPFTPGTGSAVRGYERLAASAEAGLRASGCFEPGASLRADWTAEITRDAWLQQVPTSGGHDRIPPAVLAALLDGMGAAIDAYGGSFRMLGATVGIVATRRS